MKVQYSKWKPWSLTDDERLENMFALFSYLLIQTDGDVEDALNWLEKLSVEYQLFDDNLSFSEFVDELKKKGYIAKKKWSVNSHR